MHVSISTIFIMFFLSVMYKSTTNTKTRKVKEEIYLILSRFVVLGILLYICNLDSDTYTQTMYKMFITDPFTNIHGIINNTFNNTTNPVLFSKDHVDMTMSLAEHHVAFWIAEIGYLIIGGGNNLKRDPIILLHHIITIVLITLAIDYKLFDFFLFVSFIHDVSDIFISLTKITHTMGIEGPAYMYFTEVCFIVMVGVWTYTRVFLFGYLVLALTTVNFTSFNIYQAIQHVQIIDDTTSILVFIILLWSLLCMQFHWTFLIIKMAMIMPSKGAAGSGDVYIDTTNTTLYKKKKKKTPKVD